MYLARDIGTSDPDERIRAAALAAIERISRQRGGRVQWADVERGFNLDGERIHFASRAQGIFKPRQMSAALSLKAVIPRTGREAWYRDQGLGGRSSDPETGLLRYDLARGGPDEPSNRSLLKAMERQDGDLLATLKDLEGTRLRLPSQREDWPNPTYLEQRFGRFEAGLV